MPITKSAKKALRQSSSRRALNLQRKKELKAQIKKFRKLLESDKEAAQKQLSVLFKKLDKGAKVNLIKKNTASRLKSRFSKKLLVATKKSA